MQILRRSIQLRALVACGVAIVCNIHCRAANGDDPPPAMGVNGPSADLAALLDVDAAVRKAAMDRLSSSDAGRMVILEALGAARDKGVKKWLMNWATVVQSKVAVQGILTDKQDLRFGALFILAKNFADNAGATDQDLIWFPQVAGKVMALTGDSSPEISEMAVQAMAKLGRYATADTLAALAKPDLATRRTAARILGLMFQVPDSAADPLAKAIFDPDAQLRAYAAFSMGRVDETTSGQKRPLAAFLSLSKEKNPAFRQNAVDGLAAIDRQPQALAALHELTSDPDALVSIAARVELELQPARVAWRVRQTGRGMELPPDVPPATGPAPEPPIAIATLVKMVEDPAQTLASQQRGVTLLRYYGLTSAKDAAAALARVLAHSTDRSTRLQATESLEILGHAGATQVGVIIDVMQEDDLELAQAALRAAGAMGPGAKEAIPTIVKLWDADEHRLYEYAHDVLAGIGEPAVPALIAIIEKGGANAYYAAISWARLDERPLPAVRPWSICSRATNREWPRER